MPGVSWGPSLAAQESVRLIQVMLQINPAVTDLALFDIAGTPGVAADISHINSKARTKVMLCPKRPAVTACVSQRLADACW